MPRLSNEYETHLFPESIWSRSWKFMKKYSRKTTKAIMRSYHFRIPVYDMPVRLRPWFLIFTSLTMITLAFLGFTNFAHSLPFNDKLLHFFCLMLATGVFYFIFDVEEDARRVWFWRKSPLIFTGVVCFIFGGIISEMVQSLLPYKEFQFGDIVANILGSSLGLYIAYYLEKYYRHRREISRLYRPLDTESIPSDDEEDESGTQLLPTHYEPVNNNTRGAGSNAKNKNKPAKMSRLTDVWDEREELFDIGGDSEDEDGNSPSPIPSTPGVPVGVQRPATNPVTPPGPQIVVTHHAG
ncbi:hypothetical protein C8Q75DRAFT_770949 [Abortiporus biennis]|nr:hypothetical protein C8Q75DRAFT_770949 [Abortiporus biennis]